MVKDNKMNELTIKTELSQLNESKANQIEATFLPMIEMLKSFEEEYQNVVSSAECGVDKEVTKKARDLRLKIKKVRVEAEKARKAEKEQYLRAGKAIDGVNNILKFAVEEKENKLSEIENYFEIQEKERLKKLQEERVALVSEFLEDAHERDLSSMEEDVFKAFYESKKQAYLDNIEAEKKAEEERKAKEEAERLERIRIEEENARLKAEAEAREAELKKEREKAEKERQEALAKEEAIRKEQQAKEEQAKKEREEIEHQNRLALEKEQEKARKAKEEAERLQRVERERIEAEAKAKYDAEQAELNKGDAEKVADLISDLESIKSKYKFDSDSSKKMFSEVSTLINKIIAHIEK